MMFEITIIIRLYLDLFIKRPVALPVIILYSTRLYHKRYSFDSR
nr:MAG TPA: hypothetical protein [Caudoviricetes sp.]